MRFISLVRWTFHLNTLHLKKKQKKTYTGTLQQETLGYISNPYQSPKGEGPEMFVPEFQHPI